jgi:hypothetical protein
MALKKSRSRRTIKTDRRDPYSDIAFVLRVSRREAREFVAAVRQRMWDAKLGPAYVVSILARNPDVLRAGDPVKAVAKRIGRARKFAELRRSGTWQHGFRELRKSAVPNKRISTTPTPPASRLDWQLLPQGWWSNEVYRGVGRLTPSLQASTDRFEVLEALKPLTWYVGSWSDKRFYYVAVFAGIVIADSVDYGNALYYYIGDGDRWMSIFRRSKHEALQLGARRVIHSGNWESRVQRLVAGVASRNRNQMEGQK